MKKLGVFVGEENWMFFKEICDELSHNFEMTIYRPGSVQAPIMKHRLNDWVSHKRMRSMLGQNEVCFFEWASDLLVEATRLPKQSALVTRLHSFELYRWAPLINWDVVDKVILVSKAMQRSFCQLYPDHCHKTLVVNNGVSLTRFKPNGRRDFHFKIGMLCSIKYVKRVYEMVLAFYELKRRGFDACLYIAGEPRGDLRYAAAVQQLVQKLELQESVIFEGFIVETDAWLQDIDIFVLNSHWEGQPVALIEAMASGCYCLSHDWPGAGEVLPPENLYITQEELLDKIISYAKLRNDEKWYRQHKLRLLAIEKFDIHQKTAQIREIIEQLN